MDALHEGAAVLIGDGDAQVHEGLELERLETAVSADKGVFALALHEVYDDGLTAEQVVAPGDGCKLFELVLIVLLGVLARHDRGGWEVNAIQILVDHIKQVHKKFLYEGDVYLSVLLGRLAELRVAVADDVDEFLGDYDWDTGFSDFLDIELPDAFEEIGECDADIALGGVWILMVDFCKLKELHSGERLPQGSNRRGAGGC